MGQSKQRAQRRKSSTADTPHLRVHWRGKYFTIHPGDFSALDDATLHDTIGVGVLDVFASPSLRGLAGLVWLQRRRRNPDLSWEKVAGTFTLDDLAKTEQVIPDDADAGHPEPDDQDDDELGEDDDDLA